MALRIPTNQIITSKYTIGKEYLVLNTHKEYQGYFYEMNNKFFAGKEFDINAPELIKVTSDKVNPLLLNPKTSTYGKLSGIKLDNTDVRYYNDQIESERNDIVTQYFVRNITQTNPIIIKQVDSETFNKLQTNPLYQKTSLDFIPGTTKGYSKKDIERAEKELPNITLFLSYQNPQFFGEK
jgi:hypothetical protein